MGDSGTPDRADIYGDFSVDATPLASTSVFVVDATVSVSDTDFPSGSFIRNPSII